MKFLNDWIKRLSAPRAEFGGMPACPWAAKAGISLFTLSSQEELTYFLSKLSLVLPRSVIILRVPSTVSARGYTHSSWIALESDPEKPVIIAGFRTTAPGAPGEKLILIQNRDELLLYRALLISKEYYSQWSKEDLEKIGI